MNYAPSDVNGNAPQAERQHPLSLHAAVEQVRALLDQIDPDSGELPEGFGAALALVKARAVATTAYILETERQVAYLCDYQQEIAERARTLEHRAERLREHLAAHMRAAGIDSIRDERGLFSAKLERDRDVAVELDPNASFPPDLCLPPKPPSPSKQKIKAAIESGLPIAGARLVRRDRLVVR